MVEKHTLNQPAHEQVHRLPYSFQALENTRTTTPKDIKARSATITQGIIQASKYDRRSPHPKWHHLEVKTQSERHNTALPGSALFGQHKPFIFLIIYCC